MWLDEGRKRLLEKSGAGLWAFNRRFIYIKGIRIKREYLPSVPFGQDNKNNLLCFFRT